MDLERRHDARQGLDSLLYLDLEPNNGGIVLDLSETGMQISVANPLVRAKEVSFSLCLEARSRVRGTGRIAWISASGKSAGVHFLALPKETLEQIQKFLGRSGAGDGHGTAPAQIAEPEPPAGVQTPAPPQESPAVPPPLASDADPTPSVLTLDDGKSLNELPAAQASAAETETRAPETIGCEAGKTAEAAPAADSAGEQPPIRFFLDRFPQLSKNAARKKPKQMHAAPPRKAVPAVPPASRHAARFGTSGPDAESVHPWPLKMDLPPTPGPTESSSDAPLPSPGPLYLPNYRVDEKGTTGDVHITELRLNIAPLLAAKLIFERFEEFGWALEHDWHIWAALGVLLAGFLALAQDPPMPMVTVALWFASAMFMVGRKRSGRESAGRPKPGAQ